jgi:hypothetical protein
MLLANAVLSHEHGASGDSARAASFRSEAERFRSEASAATHAIAEKLTRAEPRALGAPAHD